MLQTSTFYGKNICFDLSGSSGFKNKKELVEKAKANGFSVSYGINKKVDFLIKDDETDLNTFKYRTALNLNIPVLRTNFLFAVNDGLSTDLNNFLIMNKNKDSNMREGVFKKSNEFYLSHYPFIINYH